MIDVPQVTATGQLAIGPKRMTGGFPVKPYIVFVPEWADPVHEFDSLIDVGNFVAMRRIRLEPLGNSEGYPADWNDVDDADWIQLR